MQEVEKRTIFGKKVKALRRSGVTPANVFGHGIESIAIQVETAEIEKLIRQAGGTRMIQLKNPSFTQEHSVLVKHVQRDAISGKLLHIDFYKVSMEDKIKVGVPIIFEGESPASRRKELVLLEIIGSVEVECLPTDIPENIVVNRESLADAGDHILVGDIALDDKVSMLTSPEDVIAKVEHAKTAEIEEAAEEEGEIEGEAAEAKPEAEASAEQAEAPQE